MKLRLFLFSLMLPVLLCACGRQEPNTLFDKAQVETGIMQILVCDESGTSAYWLSNDAVERAIVNDLKHTTVKPATVTTKDVTYPIYSIMIPTTEGLEIAMSWSNGYLYDRDGAVYKFDYDFEKTIEQNSFELDGHDGRGLFFTARYMVLDEDGWNPKFMVPAGEPDTSGDITLEADFRGDTIHATLRNNTDAWWEYGAMYWLEVQLGEQWYLVPETPEGNWGFPDIGYNLPPGEETERIYDLAMYGELPQGHYRIVVENTADEFDVP